MLKKRVAVLAVSVLTIALACKPTEPTNTGTTQTSATTATTTGTSSANAPAQHEIDHYKFWKVASVPYQRSVSVQGQFDQQRWQADVQSVEYLGNPVQKNSEPVLYPDQHLVGYAIKAPPQQPRRVLIENQFEKSVWLSTTDAAWLLLPATKSLTGPPSGPPKEMDHYVCYAVQPTNPVAGPVQLFDQLDKQRGKKESINSLSAAFFCVPVSKNGSTIARPKEHLTVYKLDPPDSYAITVYTWDQFDQRKLNVQRSEFLAVPTTKLDWK